MLSISPTSDPSAYAAETNLSPNDTELERAAKEFEAAFISQMLTFSGVGEALVSGDGQMASAFTGFFIEALSEDLADTGAFGLAEKFYDKLKSREDL